MVTPIETVPPWLSRSPRPNVTSALDIPVACATGWQALNKNEKNVVGRFRSQDDMDRKKYMNLTGRYVSHFKSHCSVFHYLPCRWNPKHILKKQMPRNPFWNQYTKIFAGYNYDQFSICCLVDFCFERRKVLNTSYSKVGTHTAFAYTLHQ